MALEYQANLNESIFIRLQLRSADTGLYPQAKIYAIDDPSTVVDTLDLDELTNGLYGKSWTNNGEVKKYFTQVIVYTDAGHTTAHDEIRPDTDSINVVSSTVASSSGFGGFSLKRGKTSVQRLGLTEEEIQKIAKAVFNLLKPELDKKSEFNASNDKVMADLPPMEMPPIEFPPIPTVYDIAKAVVKSLDIDTKLNSIKPSDPLKLEEVVLAVERLIKDNKVDNTAEIMKLITDNKIDYSKFDEIKQVIADNKVVVPDPIVPKNYDSDLATLNDRLISLSKVEEERDNIRQIINLINIGGDYLQIYELFKKISKKEKELVFNFLAKNNVTLLKQLGQMAEAESIVKQIESADDKNTIFTYLVRIGKINKSLIPMIKRMANVN